MDREKERVKIGYSKQTCSQSVSVKITGLGNFLEESKFLLLQPLDILNLAGRVSCYSHLHSNENQ